MSRSIAVVIVCLTALALTSAQDAPVQRASDLELSGRFSEAAKVLSQELDAEKAPERRKLLAFELDRLKRIALDYPLTKEQTWKQVQRSIRDVTEAEFESWITEGRLDFRMIDGQQRFNGVSRSNLFWRYPELVSRSLDKRGDFGPLEKYVWQAVQEISNATQLERRPYVLPKRFRMTAKVSVRAGAAPHGSTIRTWIPIPREFPFQTKFQLVSSSSPARLDDPESPIRSAYMEQSSDTAKNTVFAVEYEYTFYGIQFDLQPERSEPFDLHDPAVRDYTSEGPHVVFTEKMRSLARQIGGDEKNPIRLARKFYEWIADSIKYSYALEYSTIRNIGDYCASKRYGDCGQEALLYITLCRLNGIPARWQSGWFTMPGGKTIHDWTEVYLSPWGWVPVDPYMGIFAMQYLKGLTLQQRIAVRDFYFGGLDAYRVAANSGHNQDLRPPKKGLRSDNVDFQRGEVEANGENIYFDKYSYSLDVLEIPTTQK